MKATSRFCVRLGGFLTLAFAAIPLYASSSVSSDAAIRNLWTSPTVEEAFSTPYGSALLREFEGIVIESADPACLKEKALNLKQGQGFGMRLLAPYGRKLIEQLMTEAGWKRIEAEFLRQNGQKTLEEFYTLSSDSIVRAFHNDRMLFARDRIADVMTEQLDLYRQLMAITLTRPLNPTRTGRMDILALSRLESDDEGENFISQNAESMNFTRYMELLGLWLQSAERIGNPREALEKPPLHEAFAGIENDLRAYCVNVKAR